ncbi:unnamed protein product [Sphagnum jensenii]|uniref:ATP-dependent DNA helicase n=1 Tax=Sphagnum jensenii TaxID=128206 RepID=A0ABP0VYG0_9BRYO
MENQLILLLSDDDDDEPILYSQTQSGLTSEQRSRSARQKRLAMERRQARELRNVVDAVSYNGGGPCQPSIIHHGEMESQRWRGAGSYLGTRLGLEELSTNHHHARIGHSTTTKTAAAALDNGSSCQPGFAGTENCPVELVRDCGQQAAKRGRVEDQVGECRSVRKTPARGSSFGRNISIPCFQQATPSSSPHEEEEQGEAVLNPETWKKMRYDAGCPKLKESLEFVETKKFTPSEQQMEVLHAIARGKSVFVTGSAGTGKSFMLADALQCLREKFGNDAVFITASTGLAACSLGGTSLNTFAGVGFGKGRSASQPGELLLLVCFISIDRIFFSFVSLSLAQRSSPTYLCHPF